MPSYTENVPNPLYSQADLKVKIEEVQQTKDKVRLEKETVQQKEIDISRLNGRVQFLEEEMEALKSRTGDCDKLDGEINSLRSKLNYEQTEHEVTRSDNIKLSSELQQLQVSFFKFTFPLILQFIFTKLDFLDWIDH